MEVNLIGRVYQEIDGRRLGACEYTFFQKDFFLCKNKLLLSDEKCKEAPRICGIDFLLRPVLWTDRSRHRPLSGRNRNRLGVPVE